jgi:hypothetical protein
MIATILVLECEQLYKVRTEKAVTYFIVKNSSSTPENNRNITLSSLEIQLQGCVTEP